LLLIEKDDGVRGKAFAARGSDGGLRIGVAELGCVGDGFQFGVSAEAPLKSTRKPKPADSTAARWPVQVFVFRREDG
jgi:Fe-S cluster assembly iron-binding protein IscA